MKVVLYGKPFLKDAKKLPTRTQRKLAKLLETLADDPFHPTLHSKPLSGTLSGFFSFRVTREYRVIFQFIRPDTIELITVKHRKDIYR